MKYAKLLMVFLVITLFGVFQLGCGGGSSGTVADDGGDDPVVVDDSVTTLTSGMEDVATDAVLEYTFDTAQDPDSVTTSTVYLVPRGTTASANLSADFDLSVDDYSYSNDCDVESAMSGISVESEDGTSVTITSSYEYMGGGIFALCIDGEESIVIFSTEGDLETDCAALFDGESCTYDAELDEGSLSYDVLAAAMEGNADGLAAFCIYGAGLGDSDCLEEESVETIMALFGDEESEDEHLTWGDESADSEEVFLVEGLDGDSQVFTMQGVNLDDEETWGANPYMLYADTGDTTDILRAELGWLYDEFAGTEDDVEDNCWFEGTCDFEITRAAIADIASIMGYTVENWGDEDRCFTIHWKMYLGCTIDGEPGDECDANDTFTEDRATHIESVDGACDEILQN